MIIVTLGTVVIRDAIVSLLNNGVLEITNSKISSLTNNNCASIYNNYIFAPIVSTGGTVNMAENIICPSATSLTTGSVLNASNTNARVLSNTILNNSPTFIAYTADDNSVIRSTNNTFRVTSTTPFVGSSTNGSSLITNDDAWTSAALPERYTVPGITGTYDANLNFNGNDVINALYTGTTTVTTAYATTPSDHTIVVEAPGGDITLSTPPEDGQIIFVKNNSPAIINVGTTPLDPGDGAVFTYADGAWQLIANTGGNVIPPVAPFFVNDTVFVDAVYGNNGTAAPEDPARPAATIEFAVSIAPTPTSLIFVRPGTYTPATGFTTNNFEFLPSTIVNWTAAGDLFGGTSNVYSNGIFNLNGTGTLFSTSGTVDIDTANQVAGTTGNIFDTTDAVIKANRVITATTSTLTTSTADIKQVTLLDANITYFDLNTSVLSIQLLQGDYTGALGAFLFNASDNSVLRVDNALLTGNTRRFVTTADQVNLQVGNLTTVAQLVGGTGTVTGRVGSILSNTGEALFTVNTLVLALTIDLVVSTDVDNYLTANSSIEVKRWEVSGSSNNWNPTNSTLSIGTLIMTDIPTTLFQTSSTPTISVDNLESTNSSFLSQISGTLSLAINRVNVISGSTTTPFISGGAIVASINDVTYNGSLDIPFFSAGNQANSININNYTGTRLANIAILNSTFHIGTINNPPGLYTGYLFSVTNGSQHTIIVDNMIINDSHLLTVTTAIVKLQVSGTIVGALTLPFIVIPANNDSLILVGNLEAPGNTQPFISYTGVGAIGDIQKVNIDNMVYGTGALIGVSPTFLELNVNNLVTAGNIIDVGAGQDISININNLQTSSSISTVTYSLTTVYRLHLVNASITGSAVGITVNGITHVANSPSGVFIEVEAVECLGTSQFLVANADALIQLRSENLRGLTATLVTINSNGTFTRISGKYALSTAGNPTILVNVPTPAVGGTIQGIYFCHTEIIGSPSYRINVVLTGTVNTYNVRIFSMIVNTAVSIVTAGPGTFTVAYPIQTVTVYTPLPN